ncbi:unnamed protein product, partial [Mycena citricolor]
LDYCNFFFLLLCHLIQVSEQHIPVPPLAFIFLHILRPAAHSTGKPRGHPRLTSQLFDRHKIRPDAAGSGE